MTDVANDTGADASEMPPAAPEMHGCPVTDSFGQTVLHVTRDRYVTVVKVLVDEGYTMCADLTAVDFLTHPGRSLPAQASAERFEVVSNLLDIVNRRRIRLRVQVPEDDPTIASLFDVYPGTEAMEREVYDMFGISFSDHPDMSRILMPEDWIGHPLRKDYEIGKIPVQFKAAHS